MATQPSPDLPVDAPMDDPVPTPNDPIPPTPTDPVTLPGDGNPFAS